VNVAFVSHCDFSGNSAMHIFSVANELQRLGVESVVCVPNDPGTVSSHGKPLFRVLHHDDAMRDEIVFSDGRGPDLIHAWTPRELVRRLTERLSHRYSVPYFVHLEDNEEVILEDDLGVRLRALDGLPLSIVDQLVAEHRTNPLRSQRFLAGAAGVTVLMDRLLEFKPAQVPGLVFWPGFDSDFADAQADPRLRRQLGLGGADLLVAYTGNVHRSNVDEAASLVAAVAALRRRGHRLVLVKTGWNFSEIPYFDEGMRQGFIVDLGFCPRSDIPRLVGTADVLIQPGRPGEFNDFRFPSKLPEFLVSGRPVVLPRSNIGRFLHDGIDCVLLNEGHALDIAARLEPLLDDPGRRNEIGASGREFALRELTWHKAAVLIRDFYDDVLGLAAPAATDAGREAAPAGAREPAAAAGSAWYTKLIAFYLPQYHRIEENDAWWGDGFTEWTNVRRAAPNFEGHQQPQLPSDLGFYDLMRPEVMDRQAELARSFGIYGFCYYHYWFNARRLLERPVEQMLARGMPDFPFCLCWANENWTRCWDGSEDEVLIRQEYAPGFAERFIRDVIPVFKDPRYIRVGGAPILLVYRADLLPDATATARRWRQVCAEEGIGDIHLAAVQSFGIRDPQTLGFDAAVEFPPHVKRELVDPRTIAGVGEGFEGYLEDFERVVRNQISQPPPAYIQYRGVMPAWDNTPRRMNRAHVCINSTPAAYQSWLERVVDQTMARAQVQAPLVFINAWNEWAEGAFLEPDRQNGYARLEATRHGLCRGMADHFAHDGIPVSEEMIRRSFVSEGVIADETLPAGAVEGGHLGV